MESVNKAKLGQKQRTTTGSGEVKKERHETEQFACYLSPNKLSQPEENTPHPLLQVQRLTAEWLPSKLHNHNLHKAKGKKSFI